MDQYTTYKIGGSARYFFSCNTVNGIQKALSWCDEQSLPWFILGNGSNILIADKGFAGLVIKLSRGFKAFSFAQDTVEVGGGALMPALSSHCLSKGWGGFEFMCGIPGTIGGGVRMNAGTRDGEIKDHFISAIVQSPNGNVNVVGKDDMNFSHRHSMLANTRDIVLSVRLKLSYPDKPENIKEKIKKIIAIRRAKQPKIKRNCGFVFKKPPGGKPAGWYIDQAGLKGLRIGDAMVAHEHANWILNLGNAKADQVKALISKIQDEVMKKFGVSLEREVIYVPEDFFWSLKLSDILRIQKSRLEGKVTLSGAKNSVLRLLAASILINEKIELHNYPSELSDAAIHVEMLELLGKKCTINKKSIVIEQPVSLESNLEWQGRSIRNTLLILGALTAKTGFGCVPLPGGCKLGERKYDLHELVLQNLGAKVWEEKNTLCAEAPKGLNGADIHLPIRSTGATENAIIASSLARGVTRIWNPHIRPEIIDLINFLKSMGAGIVVHGQEHIEVTGVEGLCGTTYSVMPDNMEAITWVVGAVMTGGDVEIHQFPHRDLEVPMIHLRESGARFYTGEDVLIVRGGRCYPVDISTGPFPGINSDVQPILAAMLPAQKGNPGSSTCVFPAATAMQKKWPKWGWHMMSMKTCCAFMETAAD